jgi:hypothetical protein
MVISIFVVEDFSLDESTSPKQPWLRPLNRGWKAAPAEKQLTSKQLP